MTKKLSLLLAAVAAIAFGAPASASAAPGITGSFTSLLSPGTKLTAWSTNMKIHTSLGDIVCGLVTVNTLEITENSGSSFEVVGTTQGGASSCSIEGGASITITDLTLMSMRSFLQENFEHKIERISQMSLTLVADLPGVTCHFSSSSMRFFYFEGTTVVEVVGEKLKASPLACQPGTFSATFVIEKNGGGTILFDS